MRNDLECTSWNRRENMAGKSVSPPDKSPSALSAVACPSSSSSVEPGSERDELRLSDIRAPSQVVADETPLRVVEEQEWFRGARPVAPAVIESSQASAPLCLADIRGPTSLLLVRANDIVVQERRWWDVAEAKPAEEVTVMTEARPSSPSHRLEPIALWWIGLLAVASCTLAVALPVIAARHDVDWPHVLPSALSIGSLVYVFSFGLRRLFMTVWPMSSETRSVCRHEEGSFLADVVRRLLGSHD